MRRASLALFRMLEVADEVVLVDLNSPPNASGHAAPLVDRLPAAIRHSHALSICDAGSEVVELLRQQLAISDRPDIETRANGPFYAVSRALRSTDTVYLL